MKKFRPFIPMAIVAFVLFIFYAGNTEAQFSLIVGAMKGVAFILFGLLIWVCIVLIKKLFILINNKLTR